MIALLRLVGLGCLCLIIVASSALPGQADKAAVERLTRVLAAAEEQDGKASPRLLPVIAELAEAQSRDGALAGAAALRRRALDIAVAAYGSGSPRAATAMVALALLDIERQRYLDAEPLLIIARRVSASGGEIDDPTRATIFTGLARIALARGDTSPAEAWARRAVEVARRHPHTDSAAPLRALGAVLTAEARFADAERVLDAALAEDRRRSGDDAPETARSLAQLAHLYLRQEKPRAALPLIEEATAIDQRRLGPAHPLIADDLHDLGLVYDGLHRPDAARRAFLAAIALLERGAGRETPRVAYAQIELSRLYREAGDDAAADAAFRDARRILNKAEAEEHRRERKV